MSATIIQFSEAKQRIIARKTYSKIGLYKKSMPGSAAFLEISLKIQSILFNQEYNNLIKNFNTRSTYFMFPTILSGYKKGINPADAIYNDLQESLFKYDINNKFYMWTINLFKNEEWVDILCHALQKDIISIDLFQTLKFDPTNGIGDKEIKDLELMKNNFIHYIEVFNSMKTWEPN